MSLPKPLRAAIGILMFLYITVVATIGVSAVMVLYCVLRPFSEGAFLKIGCLIQGSFLVHFALFIEILCGIRLDVRGELPQAEAALVIANHLTHDWMVMYPLAYRMGTLAYVRTVIKKAVAYIPGMGWGMWVLYWPFVSRDFKKDESVLKSLFGAYERHNLPVQTWLYPEGTRRTPKKLKESQDYARDNNMTVFNHVMIPRHRGFSLAVNSLRGAVRWVHELTIAYEGWHTETPGLWDFMTTDPSKRHVMHVYFERTPMSTLPADDNEKKQWLQDAFTRKEQHLSTYARQGHFDGERLTRDLTIGPMIPHLVGWLVIVLTTLKLVF